jgi:hypothetical protein
VEAAKRAPRHPGQSLQLDRQEGEPRFPARRLRVHEEPLAEFLIREKLPQRSLHSLLSHGRPPFASGAPIWQAPRQSRQNMEGNSFHHFHDVAVGVWGGAAPTCVLDSAQRCVELDNSKRGVEPDMSWPLGNRRPDISWVCYPVQPIGASCGGTRFEKMLRREKNRAKVP